MVKYFKELENRKNYYLPLIEKLDKGKLEIYDSLVPSSFIERYADLFSLGKTLLNIFNNINIDEWLNISFIDYEEKWDIVSEYNKIKEDELHLFIENIKNSNSNYNSVKNYLYGIDTLTKFYQDIFQHNKDIYKSINVKTTKAINELDTICTIKYQPEKEDKLCQPDAWYITPNNYLYNPGEDGHKSRDLYLIYMLGYNDMKTTKKINYDFKWSKYYKEEAKTIIKNGYVTMNQYREYLNYYNKPVCLEEIDGIAVTREKHVINIVLGVINGIACFEEFFENLSMNTENPKKELNKIKQMTNNDIKDILVRCCGFHKVESTVDKTITTSLINYEEEFDEYIEKGFKILFIPPIIIDEFDHTVKEYPEEFLKIKKVLKK